MAYLYSGPRRDPNNDVTTTIPQHTELSSEELDFAIIVYSGQDTSDAVTYGSTLVGVWHDGIGCDFITWRFGISQTREGVGCSANATLFG
jgi:hypothetical protein